MFEPVETLGVMLQVRIRQAESEWLDGEAKKRKTTKADVIRRALRDFAERGDDKKQISKKAGKS